MVWTQIQPAMGIKNWKPPKVVAMRSRLFLLITGSSKALAMETEKASMARPAPRARLLTKKRKIFMR